MKLWITRDGGNEAWGSNEHVHLWQDEPAYNKREGWVTDGGALSGFELAAFKLLTGLPLPPRGSIKLVEVKMEITPVKGK